MKDDVLDCIIINHSFKSETTSQGFGTVEFMETLQVR